MHALPPQEDPSQLIALLSAHYRSLSYILCARLIDTYPEGNLEHRTTLLCLEVKEPHAERAARATCQALQSTPVTWSAPIDVMTCAPGEQMEMFEHGIVIYKRDPNLTDNELVPGLPERRLGASGETSQR